MIPISQAILQQAVALRQTRRMSLVHNLILVTRNVEDFKWINQLNLVNPFDSENSN